MPIGDTFSGLAADRRAINAQSSANWFNNIGARRAQQAQDIAAEQAGRNYLLQIRQLNDQAQGRAFAQQQAQDAAATDAARYNLQFATGRQDAANNLGLAEDQANLNWEALAQRGDLRDQAAALKLDQVDQAGQSLASSFGAAKEKADAADKQLRDLLDEQTRTAQQAANLGFTFDARTGLLKAPKVANPRATPELIAQFNNHMMSLNNDLKQAKQDAALGYHGLNTINRTAASSGYDLIPDKGLVVHRRTGKQFNFGQPAGLTEEDMIQQGFFAPTAPAQPAPVAVPPQAQWSAPVVAPAQSMGSSQMPAFLQQIKPPGPNMQVARPVSIEEFALIPVGAFYINPADGKTYRKTR